MFLQRQGLNMLPSQNFIDKFIEIYNELLYRNKSKANVPPIDEKTAIFFINTVIESIIYCIDFGYDVWITRTMVFLQRISDYRRNNKNRKKAVTENVKKLTVKPIISIYNRIRREINKDNKEYMLYLDQKTECYKKIKKYYKEFYGKETEWWTKD
jgi:hypothetical protein